MDIREAARTAAKENPYDDANELAQGIVKKAKVADLVPLLAEEIAHIQRSYARSLERKAFADTFHSKAANVGAIVGAAADFRSLFRQRFALGDGTEVEWGKATIEQHRARIGLLEQMRAGITATIEQHEQAIQAIQKAGVSCLEEAESAEAAA